MKKTLLITALYILAIFGVGEAAGQNLPRIGVAGIQIENSVFMPNRQEMVGRPLSLPDYCTTDLNLSYTLTSKHAKSVRFGVMIYNLFDARYCGNGYGYSYMDGGKRYDDAYYFPQAPLNVLANVTITF